MSTNLIITETEDFPKQGRLSYPASSDNANAKLFAFMLEMTSVLSIRGESRHHDISQDRHQSR